MSGKMEESTLVSGSKTICTGKVCTNGLMVALTQVTSSKIKDMAMEFICILTTDAIKVTLKTDFSTAWESL